jgi:hypothetical protein
VYPGYPAQPGQPTHSGYPAHHGYAAHPGHPAQPGYAAQPGHPGQSGHPATQGYPGYPAHPTQPGYAAQSGYPTQPGYPAHPGYPGYPAQQPPASRRWLRTGIAVAVAAAVLASIGVGVYALTKDDGGDGASRADSQQGPDGRGDDSGGQDGPFGDDGGDGGSGGQDGDESGPGQPEVEAGGTVSDPVNGISIRVPDGWTGRAMAVGAQLASDDTYPCPGQTSQTCTKGGAYSAPAELLETKGSTPEAVAKADIAENAEESYGGPSYGKITSHQVLASKAVTVAGQKGYLVRWKAVTSKGADGLVQSIAFPSPADAERIVVVRVGVDDDQTVSLIDEITKSIKAAPGGGYGQDV